MKHKTMFLIAVTVCLSVSAVGVSIASDFSADMISKSGEGTFQSRVFITNQKTRMESQDAVTISRLDKKVVWILMPQERMYMEQPFDDSKAVARSEKVDNEIGRTLVGKETIDGMATEKYKILYEREGEQETMFQWIAVDTKIPVKLAAGDDSWTIEYKNIKPGKQPDALFEIPAGYEKFAVEMPTMSDVMGGMGR